VARRIAMASLVLFLLIVVLCLAAPLYAHDVAHVNPFVPNLNGHTLAAVGGRWCAVLGSGHISPVDARRYRAHVVSFAAAGHERTRQVQDWSAGAIHCEAAGQVVGDEAGTC
jgi:hypothetical protein